MKDLPACPVKTTLMLIGDKWKALIQRKPIGHVSQKVLTDQLRAMEASGLVSRRVYAEVPPGWNTP